MTSWQKTLLVMAAMALVVVCRLSKVCGDNPGGVEHLAYVVVGAVFGLTSPGALKGGE